jgi:predicted neuraminidase
MRMDEAILESGFLYESAPFPSCHASTIVETGDGLLAGWFGGTRERHPDVCIYVSRLSGWRPGSSAPQWSEPVLAADGVQADGSRQPCWNPVLFLPRGGPLMLFYKVGPSPSAWWGMLKTSDDHGRSWSEPIRLPEGILGPIKNKPIQLANGHIISPTSVEGPQVGWRVYFERSTDGGRTWSATPYVEHETGVKAIQPSILIHSQQRLQAIGRTRSQRLFEVWSEDGGLTWGRLSLTGMPNCNSGTDAVTLQDGRHLLVYNHSETEKVRVPLNLAVSHDGRNWKAGAVLETEPPGQYSYPAVIQASDGFVHITYTWKRLRIKHAVIDPRGLGGGRQIREGTWPSDA